MVFVDMHTVAWCVMFAAQGVPVRVEHGSHYLSCPVLWRYGFGSYSRFFFFRELYTDVLG